MKEETRISAAAIKELDRFLKQLKQEIIGESAILASCGTDKPRITRKHIISVIDLIRL